MLKLFFILACALPVFAYGAEPSVTPDPIVILDGKPVKLSSLKNVTNPVVKENLTTEAPKPPEEKPCTR